MTENKKPKEIADVIATVIVKSHNTTIITPSGKLFLQKGISTGAEPIKDYSSAVNEELEHIKQRASHGLFCDEYQIRIYGKIDTNLKG